MSQRWPTELRLAKDRRTFAIVYDDGAAFTLSAELLRVCSPSAEVRGHSEAERKTVGGKRNVEIGRIEEVGNYAVRLIFSDGHDTGIYTWSYLAQLGEQADAKFNAYLGELAAKGLDRDRPGQR